MDQEGNIFNKYKRILDQAKNDHVQKKRKTKMTKIPIEENFQDIFKNGLIKQNLKNRIKLSPSAPTWAKDLNYNGKINTFLLKKLIPSQYRVEDILFLVIQVQIIFNSNNKRKSRIFSVNNCFL